MTTNSDFDRRAAAYLADGPTQLADRVLDAALRDVHKTRQRHRWSVPRRFQPMFSVARLAAVAAVALVAVSATYIGVTGPNPSPSPSPTAVVVRPSSAPCFVTPVNRQLLASDCTYTFDFLGIPIEIDGTGHFLFALEPDRVTLQGVDFSAGSSSLEIIAVRSLPGSPCDGDGTGLADSAPASVSDYLAWLAASPVGVYPAAPIQVGGLAGQRVRIAPVPLPTRNENEPPCDLIWLAGAEFAGKFLYVPGGEYIDIDVLDADGEIFLVVAHYSSAPVEAQSVIQAQRDAIRFQP
jgi:hypothetical protein